MDLSTLTVPAGATKKRKRLVVVMLPARAEHPAEAIRTKARSGGKVRRV